MSRRPARPARRFLRSTGPFVLRAGLSAPGAVPLGDALTLVIADWDGQGASGGVDPETARVHGSYLRGFIGFCQALGAAAVADINSQMVCDWLSAPSPRDGARPTVPVMDFRRSTVRTFFTTMYRLGLTDANPAAGVHVAPKPSRVVAPLTDSEVQALKDAADWDVLKGRRADQFESGTSKSATAVALALLGAQGGEVGAVRVRDVDELKQAVWLHSGGDRHVDRWVPMDDPWCFRVLSERRAFLWREASRRTPAPIQAEWLDTPLCYSPSKRSNLKSTEVSRRRAAGATILSQAMAHANVLRPGRNRVGSIADYVAIRVFRETKSVEAVAIRLGLTSLDTAADIVRYDWREILRFNPEAGA